MIERICNCEMIPQHLTCLWTFPDAVLVHYAAIIPKLTMLPFLLYVSIRFHLPL